MPDAATLLDGHESLRGQALRDRLTEARRAAAATASPEAIAEIDAVGIAATQACIRSYAALLPRPLADLPAAAAAGAARVAARPPAPMRKLPTPPRPADAAVPDARPATAAAPVPVADAPATASPAAGAPGTEPALPPPPAPRPPAAPSRLGNLRKPQAAPEPVEPEAPAAAAPVMVRNPLIPLGPTEGPACDAVKLAAHRRRHGASSWPFLLPNGEYNYDLPWLDPTDDLIPF